MYMALPKVGDFYNGGLLGVRARIQFWRKHFAPKTLVFKVFLHFWGSKNYIIPTHFLYIYNYINLKNNSLAYFMQEFLVCPSTCMSVGRHQYAIHVYRKNYSISGILRTLTDISEQNPQCLRNEFIMHM